MTLWREILLWVCQVATGTGLQSKVDLLYGLSKENALCAGGSGGGRCIKLFSALAERKPDRSERARGSSEDPPLHYLNICSLLFDWQVYFYVFANLVLYSLTQLELSPMGWFACRRSNRWSEEPTCQPNSVQPHAWECFPAWTICPSCNSRHQLHGVRMQPMLVKHATDNSQNWGS